VPSGRRGTSKTLWSVERSSSRKRRKCFLASGERTLLVLAAAQAELGLDRRAEATAEIAIRATTQPSSYSQATV